VAVLSILRGKRPKKPIFDTTRGYTEELWEMTTSCWKEDPTDRPAVDSVLVALKNAAGQWESEDGALDILSPRDDCSPTLAEESGSPTVFYHAGEPPAAPPSPDTFQPPAIKPLASTTINHPEPPATVDLRTPYPPSDPAKTVPSANPTTAGAPTQRTSNTRLTPDETLDRHVVRGKSPVREDAVQKSVDALEEVSRGALYPRVGLPKANDRCCGPDSR